MLVNQKVYFDNNYLPKKVEVMDADKNVQIKMNFDKIDLKTEFNDTYFDLNSVLDTESIDEDNGNNSSNSGNNDRTSNENSNVNSNTNNNDVGNETQLWMYDVC